jgi:predicted TIM-barrel fold metal-dependent hydrolase
VTNNWISEQVKMNPSRFGAFASLSMLRPLEAGKELRRAVKQLGLVGAIVNDWQATGEDGNGILLYDSPDFDPFWEVVQELDVPVYFHPKVYSPGEGGGVNSSGRMIIRWRVFIKVGGGLWVRLVSFMFNCRYISRR